MALEVAGATVVRVILADRKVRFLKLKNNFNERPCFDETRPGSRRSDGRAAGVYVLRRGDVGRTSLLAGESDGAGRREIQTASACDTLRLTRSGWLIPIE